MSEPEPRRRRRRIVLTVTAVVVVLLLGSAYVGAYVFTGERVPAGTTVMGVDIGGMTGPAAQRRLSAQLADEATRPIVLQHQGRRFPINPSDAGLRLDVESTVLNAGGGRSWNPMRMLDVLTGPESRVEPVVDLDRAALEQAIGEATADIETEPAEGALSFDRAGRPKVTEPVVGKTVDVQAAADAVEQRYLTSRHVVRLPVDAVRPSLAGGDFDDAVDEVVTRVTSGPVTLQLPGDSVSVPVRAFAPAVRFTVDSGSLRPTVDDRRVRSAVVRALRGTGEAPQPATVVLRDGRPVVVPDQPGVTVSPDEAADAVRRVLTEDDADRTVEVGTQVARASFTTADARALGITEPVSDAVTYYPHAEYRNINQSRAAELINGTVVEPGETFSFNETVGERTEANGFTKGFIISNGVFAEELGGGVSQVVTTTYNAAFFAGMVDVEHTPHSFYIDRYPVGREATVAWPSVDLKFRNDTPYGVLIQAWVVPSTPSTSGEMHVRMWSTDYWDITAGVSERYDFTPHKTRYDDSDECVPNTGYSGFSVDVYRTFRREGSSEVVKRESQHVTYTPADTVICE